MRRLIGVVLLLSVAVTAKAEDKKFLLCKQGKAETLPLVISALSEKWSIGSVDKELMMITAQKEDVKGKLWGGVLAGQQNVVLTLFIKDAPTGATGSLIELKATRSRTGDAQSNLLKYMPAGECVEHKPPKEK